ncbi:MAG: GDSL-type esterase/lipase family protein [Rhodanobacter sp.]
MPGTPTPLRYLALGDSYTIGEAVPAAARWPAVLVARLRRAGVVIDDPRIVAVTGWTTDELAHGMTEAALAPPYDLVTLQIGVNNQYRGRTTADYRLEFAELLARAITLAGNRPARVLVVSIPDWGVTRFAREQGRDPAVITAALNAFNASAQQQAAQAGAHFADITTISRHAADELASDGLHPSAAQYARWMTAILPVAREAVDTPP